MAKSQKAPEKAVKEKKPTKTKEKKPTDKLADKTALTKFLQGIFGDAQKKILKRMWKRAQEINALEPKYEEMDDEELAAQTDVFKKRIAKITKQAEAAEKAKEKSVKAEKKGKKASKKSHKDNFDREEKALNEILNDAFAVAREASRRILGLRPFDVQLIGGIALHEGNVAEMKTGEGKTLVAMLPAYLNALTGHGVHVVTVNDYLAQRDAG